MRVERGPGFALLEKPDDVSSKPMEYVYLIVFALTGALMVAGAMLASYLIAPRRPSKEKAQPYECGEEAVGEAWVQFNVGYYLFALIFLIFEVETVFLFPCAMILKEMGGLALLELGIFVAVLALGLVYAWRKGVLEWV